MKRWDLRGGCVLLSLVVATCGCGVGEYEAAMQDRAGKLEFGSKFIDTLNGEPTPLVDGVAAMQMPIAFDSTALLMERGTKNKQGDPIQPARLESPFGPIPGFRFAYEKFILLGQRNQQPVYCYVGSVPVADTPLATLTKQWQARIGRVIRGAAWSDVQLDTPDGGKLACKKLSVKGKQVFQVSDQPGDTMQLPGQFEAYVYSTADLHVVVAFRGTDEAAAQSALFQATPLALGTLEVTAGGGGGGES